MLKDQMKFGHCLRRSQGNAVAAITIATAAVFLQPMGAEHGSTLNPWELHLPQPHASELLFAADGPRAEPRVSISDRANPVAAGETVKVAHNELAEKAGATDRATGHVAILVCFYGLRRYIAEDHEGAETLLAYATASLAPKWNLGNGLVSDNGGHGWMVVFLRS